MTGIMMSGRVMRDEEAEDEEYGEKRLQDKHGCVMLRVQSRGVPCCGCPVPAWRRETPWVLRPCWPDAEPPLADALGWGLPLERLGVQLAWAHLALPVRRGPAMSF